MSVVAGLEKLIHAINTYNAGEALWKDVVSVKDELLKDYGFLKDKVNELLSKADHTNTQDNTQDKSHSFNELTDQDIWYRGSVVPPLDTDSRRKKPVPFNSDLSPISQISSHEMKMDQDLNLEEEKPHSVQILPSSTNMGEDNKDGTKGNVKETPITKAQPTYGLPNTHTTIIPYNVCMYAAGFGRGGTHSGTTKNGPGIRMDICMTAPGLRFRSPQGNNSIASYSSSTSPAGTNFNATASNTYPTLGYGTIQQVVDNFPANYVDAETSFTVTGLTSRVVGIRNAPSNYEQRPFYLEEFNEDWEYYTVLGCEYDIRIEHLGAKQGDDILIGETFTGTRKPPMINKYTVAGLTQTESVTVQNALGWKNVKWHRMNGNSKRNVMNIRGTYRTGDYKREVVDDDKVKTWNTTKPWVNPTLVEDLTLMFFQHPQNSQSYTDTGCCNIYIQLKWIVQYKDLHQYKRYVTGLYYLPADANGDTQTAAEADFNNLTDEVSGMDGDKDMDEA